MMVSASPIAQALGIAVASLGMLAAAGCASTAALPDVPLNAWSGLTDCFQRQVTVTAQTAEQAATACSGSSAGDDPARSGIDRANAFFHAASAYNLLADTGAASPLCPTKGECRQAALNLIDKSIASQQDRQIRPAADARTALVNSRFVLRRMLERNRALRGLAETKYAGASCGTAERCLTEAAAALDGADFTADLGSKNKESAALACTLLDARWRTHYALGRSYEYQYVDDLRRTVQACPALAAAASDQLAQISFDRAGNVLQALQSATPPSRDAALGAVTDYRDALGVEAFRIPAYRGIGQIFEALAASDPDDAVSYLTSASEAYETLVALSAQAGPAGTYADDQERLGNSLLALAEQTGRPGSDATQQLYTRAAAAYQTATGLAATPERYLGLGEALAATGQLDASIAAYRSAIAGLTGKARAEASFALAKVLDRTGDAAGALQMLRQAAGTGAETPVIWYEIGRREFAAGNFSAAHKALSPVTGALSGGQAAEAHYMISVAETVLHPEDWVKTAFDHAGKALAFDRRDPAYQRQACLTGILKGGKAVLNGEGLARCPDTATPEARLLRGMYFLKQAQSLDVSAYNLATQTHWRSVLRLAEDSFQGGLDELQRTDGRNGTVWFDDLGKEVDLKTRLGQGLLLVQRCNREITLEPGTSEWNDMDAFFGHYGVMKCS